MHKDEIQPGELLRYSAELNAAVEAVCSSQPFCNSAKSRQFLCYIVQLSLEGRIDELKERLIGISLLGRDASYDTGSDAGVRVRANDVRKRLAAYYAAGCADTEFTLELPAGSYVPRFYRPLTFESVENDAAFAGAPRSGLPAVEPQPIEELSLQVMALPTLVALFLCVVCVRWQLAQDHPFVTFWNTIFQEHHAMLYISSLAPGGQQDVVAERLEDTTPLFNLAGQFHARIDLTYSLSQPGNENNVLIVVGAIPVSAESADDGPSSARGIAAFEDDRLIVNSSPSGRRIVDRNAGNSQADRFGGAGLLTITNGAQPWIHIDGTDEAAIDSLITAICESSTFPYGLMDSFQQGGVTQIVFPMRPGAQAVVFHEPLPLTHTARNGPS